MPKQEDLAFIAERLRTAIDGKRNVGSPLVTLRLLIREAIALGAFAGVRFVEFRDFFDDRHDIKPNHSASLAMLAAMQWLAKNGDAIGLSMPNDVKDFDDVPACCYPGRARLRPHVELLATLVEGGAVSKDPTEKPEAGDIKLSDAVAAVRGVYEWALAEIEGANDMTIAELFDATQSHSEMTSEYLDRLPDNADTFGKYLRKAGFRRYRSSGSRARRPSRHPRT